MIVGTIHRQLAILVGCIAIGFLPGVVGAAFSPGAWYAHLDKAPLTPPGWVFPIAWTLLYLAIGLALYVFLVAAPPSKRRPALTVFAIQLALNGAWSWIFFGHHNVGLALIDILAMWVAIAVTALLFARVSRVAGYLLLPYLAWVSFATYLNVEIGRLNGWPAGA